MVISMVNGEWRSSSFSGDGLMVKAGCDGADDDAGEYTVFLGLYKIFVIVK